VKRFWNFKNASEEKVELRIDGDIVDDNDVWIYEWFGESCASPNAFRQSLKEHKGKEITVWINSRGGNVWAASGIYNALKEHDGKVIVKIDGKALSAGSIIAMAGDEVLMGPVSMMMIHNPWFSAGGDANEFRRYAEVLDQVKSAIINAYEAKTGLARDELWKLMDDETWMGAHKAVELGFADGVLYAGDAGGEPVQNSMMFSRMAIQNSATASMRRFLDVAARIRGPVPAPGAPMGMQLDLIKLKEVAERE